MNMLLYFLMDLRFPVRFSIIHLKHHRNRRCVFHCHKFRVVDLYQISFCHPPENCRIDGDNVRIKVFGCQCFHPFISELLHGNQFSDFSHGFIVHGKLKLSKGQFFQFVQTIRNGDTLRITKIFTVILLHMIDQCIP